VTELWALSASDLARLVGEREVSAREVIESHLDRIAQVNGLPQGVQVIGPRFREDLCLDAAAVIEAGTGQLTPIDPRPRPGP
jgi:Asp-tRNA(Asn)/Glu-tRNA(Gln) amidotransferase A subunit family amidase